MIFLYWGLLLDRSASVSWEYLISQFLAVASTLSWTTVLLSYLASPLSIITLHRSPVWCIMSVKPFLSSPLHNVSFQCKALSSAGDSVWLRGSINSYKQPFDLVVSCRLPGRIPPSPRLLQNARSACSWACLTGRSGYMAVVTALLASKAYTGFSFPVWEGP